MSDDFLYRLRVQPPLEFTHGLAAKLKLSPKTTRSAWRLHFRRGWPAFVLLAGTAFAAASPAVRAIVSHVWTTLLTAYGTTGPAEAPVVAVQVPAESSVSDNLIQSPRSASTAFDRPVPLPPGPESTGVQPDGLVAAALTQTRDTATTESKAFKRYKNADFGFQLDIPSSWRVVPHALCCSGELVRFSSTNSSHDYTLYIARFPHDPMQSPLAEAERAQQNLIKKQLYSNLLTGQTILGSEPVVTLDFDSLNGSRDGATHHVRDYFMISGTLVYILVFSTDRMTDGVPDQVAGSFVATSTD